MDVEVLRLIGFFLLGVGVGFQGATFLKMKLWAHIIAAAAFFCSVVLAVVTFLVGHA